MTSDDITNLIRNEFASRYHADVLPDDWTEQDLIQLARRTVRRMAPQLDRAGRSQLADALQGALEDPDHPLVECMIDASNLGWGDDDMRPVLVRLLDELSEGFRRSVDEPRGATCFPEDAADLERMASHLEAAATALDEPALREKYLAAATWIRDGIRLDFTPEDVLDLLGTVNQAISESDSDKAASDGELHWRPRGARFDVHMIEIAALERRISSR